MSLSLNPRAIHRRQHSNSLGIAFTGVDSGRDTRRHSGEDTNRRSGIVPEEIHCFIPSELGYPDVRLVPHHRFREVCFLPKDTPGPTIQ